MARDTKIGITITATDATAAAFRGVQNATRATSLAVSSMATVASGAFKAAAIAAVSLNQGLELAKKGFEAVNMVIGDTIRAALNFRNANDPVIGQFADFGRQLELVRARLGDALIPVLRGFMTALRPVLIDMQNWITVNREFIAQNFLGLLRGIGSVLINGIATGTLVAVDAWALWHGFILSTKMGLNSLWEIFLIGIESATSGIARITDVFGGPLADAAKKAAAGVTGLREEFSRSRVESSEALNATAAKMDSLHRKINAARDALKGGLAVAGANAQVEIKNGTTGTITTIEKQTAAIKKTEAALVATREAAKKSAQEMAAAILPVASMIGSSFTNAFFEVAEDIKSAEDAYRDMAKSIIKNTVAMGVQAVISEGVKRFAMQATASTALTAESAQTGAATAAAGTRIAAAAAEGQAKAVAAHAGIPFVGIAIGLAMAAAIAAAIFAFKKFAHGGLVTGGAPGEDSVPALLTPGERVLTVAQNKVFEEAFGSGDSGGGRMQSGGRVTGTGSASVININVNTLAPPDRVKWDRLIRDHVVPSLARIGAMG